MSRLEGVGEELVGRTDGESIGGWMDVSSPGKGVNEGGVRGSECNLTVVVKI